jgi:eukaryotic-like serine/threonine-protein kinase
MNSDRHNSSEDIFQQLIPNLAQGIKDLDDDLEDPFPLCDEIAELQDRYQQGDSIGLGGMKNIIDTQDALTDRHVAMALLKKSAEPELIERFFKEARLTAHLEHPNIVPLYDIGFNQEGEPYFTMKLLGGRNLTELIKEYSNQTDYKSLLPKIVDIMIKICDAMAFAHSKGVIHLDLKPDNIRIGDFGEVLICDWGLAKTLEDKDYGLTESLHPDEFNATTLDGLIKGSPGYMAPEQIDPKLGDKDERTDIYALGGLLYELLCFQVPTLGQDLNSTLQNTLSGFRESPQKINPQTPKSLESVALKGLKTNSDQRYQSVLEFRSDLYKWLGGFATSAEDHSFLKSVKLLILRHRLFTSFSFILLFAGFFFTWQVNQQKQLAIKALELFQKEQKEKEFFAKEAAPRLVGLAMSALKNNDISSATEMIELAVEADPLFHHAWHSKARIDFIKMNILEARKSLINTKQESSHQAVIELQSFLNTRDPNSTNPLSIEEIQLLAKRDQARYDIVSLITTNFELYVLKDQIQLIKALLELQNPNITNLHFDALIINQQVHLDLSNNNVIKQLHHLSKLPISHLNLSRVKDIDVELLLNLPLIEINLSKSNFTHWIELYKSKSLRSITLGRKQRSSIPKPPAHIKLSILNQ